MDHPLPQSVPNWLPAAAAVARAVDGTDAIDAMAMDTTDDVDDVDAVDDIDAMDVPDASESDAVESSEFDRPTQWIRADSSSSSRSTLLSDISAADNAVMSAWSTLANSGRSSLKPDEIAVHSPRGSCDETQWEVLDPAHANSAPAVPKIEPGEEYDMCLEDVQQAPPAATATATPPKRPRGRPRKHSNISAAAAAAAAAASSASKTAKARSKTGCTTCRRRKKKCDETKPACMNCEKNAVVCEGYKEKHVWKSGRERAHEVLLKSQPPLDITLQPIFMGMEGREDRIFWNYYRDHVSNVFTAEFDRENAFRTILVPLATTHQAMMHSVLSLASRHMKFDSDLVQKLLRRNTKVSVDSLHVRGSVHNSEALTRLSKGMYSSMNSDNWKVPDALAAQYAQMLFLVLEALAEGQKDGSQRLHYKFFLYMLGRWPPLDPDFYAFISEVFYYHIYADDLLYSPLHKKQRLVFGDWVPTMSVMPPRMIGVVDGLFNCLSQISTIRHRVRARVQCNSDPRVEYDSLYFASDIESHIHDWTPEWAAGDSRVRATLLYKQMAWLYLKTTICPPPTPYIPHAAYSSGGPASGSSALRSDPASCASSPALPYPPKLLEAADASISGANRIDWLIPAANNFSNPRRHSIANPSLASGVRPFPPKFVSFAEHAATIEADHAAEAEAIDSTEAAEEEEEEEGEEEFYDDNDDDDDGDGDDEDDNDNADDDGEQRKRSRVSPSPIRRPANYEPAIGVAVKQSLALLESFAADDRCQTLLLVPCIIVGAACYSQTDQERIRKAIRAIHRYTGLRNTDLALELLNRVWWFMDRGDFLAAWDWQTIAFDLNIHHLF